MSMHAQRAAAHKMGFDAVAWWRKAPEFFDSIREWEATAAKIPNATMRFTIGYDEREGVFRLWYGLRTTDGEKVADGNGGFYEDSTWPCPPFPPPDGGECA